MDSFQGPADEAQQLRVRGEFRIAAREMLPTAAGQTDICVLAPEDSASGFRENRLPFFVAALWGLEKQPESLQDGTSNHPSGYFAATPGD